MAGLARLRLLKLFPLLVISHTLLCAQSTISLPRVGVLDYYGLHKVSPILDWTEEQIWQYIRARQLPYNSLHDRGYPSIGCSPCTRAIQPGESRRAGRWWWEQPESRECGLHPRVRHAAAQ